jgi:hypothetical protein
MQYFSEVPDPAERISVGSLTRLKRFKLTMVYGDAENKEGLVWI